MKRWRQYRQRRFDERLYLECAAEVYALRKQVERLKDQQSKDRREFIQERREWLAREQQLVDINHDLAAKLSVADAQLIAWGAEERGR